MRNVSKLHLLPVLLILHAIEGKIVTPNRTPGKRHVHTLYQRPDTFKKHFPGKFIY